MGEYANLKNRKAVYNIGFLIYTGQVQRLCCIRKKETTMFDYDFSGLRDRLNAAQFKALVYNPFEANSMHPVTEAIITASVPCGFNRIGEDNYETIAKRITAWERTFGTFVQCNGMHLGEHPAFVTAKDVRQHIGLTTTADEMTDTHFAQYLGRKMLMESGTTEAISLHGRINNFHEEYQAA